ncbi:MAG TPA: transposase, partial [Kribbellaceae bacterium]
MDPHKRSATIEVIDDREKVLALGRYGTDTVGYQEMLAAGRRFTDRIWAIEGCGGTGRHIAQRLVADGEPVLDVPAKLSARVRVFDTGQGRKTDPVDAHSVAVAGLRSPGLRHVAADDAAVVLRLLVDRRDELGRARTETVSRIHHLLLELIPGGAKKFLTRGQASYLLRTAATPIGIVAQTRHDLARELIDDLTTIDAEIRAADKQLRQLVADHGSTLTDLQGIGPSGAARLIGDIGDIRRFRTAAHFASWNGTARLKRPPVISAATGSPGSGTGVSTGCCTSWRSSSSAVTPRAAPTTGAASRKARRRWKRSARSNATYPMSSTNACSATPHQPQPSRRAREDKRERLCDPARTAQSRRPPLRTSHSPDPPATSLKQTHRHPLTRGNQIRAPDLLGGLLRRPELSLGDATPYPGVLDELLPAAWHDVERYANNGIEADHGQLTRRLRPMPGLKTDRTVRVVIAGPACVQNLRRATTISASTPASNRGSSRHSPNSPRQSDTVRPTSARPLIPQRNNALQNLARLPPTGAMIVVAPLPIVGGTGQPGPRTGPCGRSLMPTPVADVVGRTPAGARAGPVPTADHPCRQLSGISMPH